MTLNSDAHTDYRGKKTCRQVDDIIFHLLRSYTESFIVKMILMSELKLIVIFLVGFKENNSCFIEILIKQTIS